MIGQRLREVRKQKDISQEELAKVLNITTSAVGLYETDARNPSYETLVNLANYFCVSTDWLLGVVDNETGSVNIPKGYALVVSTALDRGISPEKLKRLIELAKELESV